jgi:hypothetical protein
MAIKGLYNNKKEIMEIEHEMKAVGANFDRLQALDEVVNKFKKIQQLIQKWEERQGIYNHKYRF